VIHLYKARILQYRQSKDVHVFTACLSTITDDGWEAFGRECFWGVCFPVE